MKRVCTAQENQRLCNSNNTDDRGIKQTADVDRHELPTNRVLCTALYRSLYRPVRNRDLEDILEAQTIMPRRQDMTRIAQTTNTISKPDEVEPQLTEKGPSSGKRHVGRQCIDAESSGVLISLVWGQVSY